MKPLRAKGLILALSVVAAVAVPVAVSAWGATGHRLIGIAAMRALPDTLPAFIRGADAIAEIGELSREPDRWKGAGQPHDREREWAHFIDLDETGHVITAQGASIDALPRLKSEYDVLNVAAGLDPDDTGALPYAIMDAWQQVRQDFAYWRVLTAIEARETDLAKKAWYREDRLRREALTLRDLGVLSHYVADGSQPHHVTIHYNGWGDYPNPERFTMSRQTHALFEGAFIRRVARLDAIEAAMPASRVEGFEIRARTVAYIRTTLDQVTPFYRLEKDGAFPTDDAGLARIDGVNFATERLAAGAAEVRDLTITAWQSSAEGSVGWPAVKVADVVAGTVDPWVSLTGQD